MVVLVIDIYSVHIVGFDERRKIARASGRVHACRRRVICRMTAISPSHWSENRSHLPVAPNAAIMIATPAALYSDFTACRSVLLKLLQNNALSYAPRSESQKARRNRLYPCISDKGGIEVSHASE
jgi:hypothetical protein